MVMNHIRLQSDSWCTCAHALISDLVERPRELTSCQVDASRHAQAFAGRPDGGEQVPQGVVELRVLQRVVPQSPEQLPLRLLRPS